MGGLIGSIFGGGDDEGSSEGQQSQPQTQQNQRSFLDYWNAARGSGGGGAESYLSNFVYQPAQGNIQRTGGNSFADLSQGLISSQNGTVSGYQPLANNAFMFQPRGSLYDLYRMGGG